VSYFRLVFGDGTALGEESVPKNLILPSPRGGELKARNERIRLLEADLAAAKRTPQKVAERWLTTRRRVVRPWATCEPS
jgi:hypothetical protein